MPAETSETASPLGVEPACHAGHHRREDSGGRGADQQAEQELEFDQAARPAGKRKAQGQDDRPGQHHRSRPEAVGEAAPHHAGCRHGGKPIVIAIEMPVTDQPVSCDIGRRNTGKENMAPIATQPRRPPAATMTQRYE
jgi:hypothetical protein